MMHEQEARRLAGEHWPLTDFSRQEFMALYDYCEYLIEALQTLACLLDEERHDVQSPPLPDP